MYNELPYAHHLASMIVNILLILSHIYISPFCLWGGSYNILNFKIHPSVYLIRLRFTNKSVQCKQDNSLEHEIQKNRFISLFTRLTSVKILSNLVTWSHFSYMYIYFFLPIYTISLLWLTWSTHCWFLHMVGIQ